MLSADRVRSILLTQHQWVNRMSSADESLQRSDAAPGAAGAQVGFSTRPLESSSASVAIHGLGVAAWRVLTRIRTWQIFAAALALRLPLVWLRPPTMHTENIRAGFTLAERGYLGDPFVLPTGVTAHVSPAYPAFVAAVHSITPSDDACLHVVAVILSVVTSCNIAALLPVSRALNLPPASGTLAALLWLTPLFSWIEMSGEHETPFTVAALLALVTIVTRTIRTGRPSFGTGAWLGLTAGMAAYFTPTVVPMTALATLMGARVAHWRMKGLVAVIAGGSLAFTAVVLPYTLRNHHVFGQWFLMRDNFGLELGMSNGPDASAASAENVRLRHHPFTSLAAAAEVRELGELGYNHRMQRAATDWIKDNPRAFLELVAARAWYMVFPYSARWAQRVVGALSCLMAIAGCVLLWRSRYRVGIQCLAAAIGGYLLVYLVIEHDMRYMYPAFFLESLIAGSFVAVVVRLTRLKRSRRTRFFRDELPGGKERLTPA